MKTVVCRECGSEQKKYEHDGSIFCNQRCYFKWKRKNPNRRAYKDKILVSGYYYLYKPDHPFAIKKGRYIAEHRYILEQKIGRILVYGEIAHHLNHDKKDNRPENIELLTISEHNRHHAKSRKRKSNGLFS